MLTHLYRQATHVASRYEEKLGQGHSGRPLDAQRRSYQYDQYCMYCALSTQQKPKIKFPLSNPSSIVSSPSKQDGVSRLRISQTASNTYYPDVLLFTVGANKSNARGVVLHSRHLASPQQKPEVPLTAQQMRIIHAHARIELTDISASAGRENMLMISTICTEFGIRYY